MNPNTPAITGALNYLYSVKVAFGANSEDYLNFLEVMKDFKAKRFVQSVLKIQYFFLMGICCSFLFYFVILLLVQCLNLILLGCQNRECLISFQVLFMYRNYVEYYCSPILRWELRFLSQFVCVAAGN